MKFAAALFLLCSIFCRCTAVAQEGYYIEKPHMTFNGGLILGANMTQVDGDSYSGYSKIGINTGGVVYVHFTQYIGVSLELLYSQKGSRAVTDAQSPAVGEYIEKYNMNLNYAEVPLLFHGITTIYGHKADIELGASYGYLIKSSELIQGYQPVFINQKQDYFNTIDLNYIIGVSIKLYKNLWINGRYQYSIIPIRPMDRVPIGYNYGDKGQFNNLFAFRFMYYF